MAGRLFNVGEGEPILVGARAWSAVETDIDGGEHCNPGSS